MKKTGIEYLGERTPEQVGDTTKPAYSLFIDNDAEGGPQPIIWGHDYPGARHLHPDPLRDCDRCKGWGQITHQSAKLPPMPADAKPSDPIPWVITETKSQCPACAGTGVSRDTAERLVRSAKPFELRPFTSRTYKPDYTIAVDESRKFATKVEAWNERDRLNRRPAKEKHTQLEVWDADYRRWA